VTFKERSVYLKSSRWTARAKEPWNPESLCCSWTVDHPKWHKFIPPHRQSSQQKTTKRLAALVTISRVLPTAAGGGSTARLQQPLALLLTPSSQSSQTQLGGLPAGGTPGGANPPVLPLVILLRSKKRRHPNQSLHHSEGDFNVHKINVNSSHLSISSRKSFWLRFLPTAA
jgi:hypothetical protein